MKDSRQKKHNKQKTYLKQKGGEKLGNGGFGCVIRPPIKCTTPFNKTQYRKNTNYISKIIKHNYHQTAFNEISIGQEILKIDPFNIYFSPIINGCFLTHETHPDIQYGKSTYTSNLGKTTEMTLSENKKIRKHVSNPYLPNKCFIDRNEPYLNLIGKYSGQNLHYYLSKINTIPESLYLKNNIYYVLFHLSKAVNLLHSKKILHKDIKLSNITINFSKIVKKQNTKTITSEKSPNLKSFYSKSDLTNYKIPSINLIDFGLSVKIPKNAINEEIYKIVKNGTHNYIPPEIYILKNIIKIGKSIKITSHNEFEKIILKKIEEEFDNYRYYLNRNGFGKNGFSILNLDNKNQTNFISKEMENKLVSQLVNIYINNQISQEFLHDNLILSWDIYSLGIVFSKIIQKIKINDNKINNLISDMVSIDYRKRITSKELIKLNIFKDFI